MVNQPHEVIRDQFESMVGKMHAEKQARDVVAAMNTSVQHTGGEQVAALNNKDMDRGPSGKGVAG